MVIIGNLTRGEFVVSRDVFSSLYILFIVAVGFLPQQLHVSRPPCDLKPLDLFRPTPWSPIAKQLSEMIISSL